MPAVEDTCPNDPLWLQICAAATLDPQRRLDARLAILVHPQALDCTLYRPDPDDLEAEEAELGDARILLLGTFQAPSSWDEAQCEAYFDDCDPALFMNAYVECEAAIGSSAFFTAEQGDHLASMTSDGRVEMYFVHECRESQQGRLCVLIRDDQPLF